MGLLMPTTNSVLPDWRAVQLPSSVRGAETMLLLTEQQLLYSLASEYFENKGSIVDAGCFLGGSTLALAQGLRDNPAYRKNPRGALIHSYDLFVVEPWTIGIYFPKGTPLGTSFEPIFRKNTKAFSDLITIHGGDVTKAELPEGEIEILFIDLAKHWLVNDYVVKAFFPKLIPGKSIVIQQDYLFHTWTGWLPVTMEYFSEYFEIVDHTEKNSVVFLYKKQIPAGQLAIDLIQSLTRGQMLELANRAIARFSGLQAEILVKSRDQFQNMLASINWPA
jgi:hypothetical protein